MQYEATRTFALQLDEQDELKSYRDLFYIPEVTGKPSIYFVGNSLGAQPKPVEDEISKQLLAWRQLGVEGYFLGEDPWLTFNTSMSEMAAKIVGAKAEEVMIMNTLTVNLHLLMVSFYRPTSSRFKIITEKGAFPSDQYALESQVKIHGFDPDEAIVELAPREGEKTLRTEDILEKIEEVGDSLALIMMGGVNYYTGQFFDLKNITKKGHEVGAKVGFDLAHAAGNVSLALHDWEVDFAVWCTYKYLNSSPGGVSGVFVHDNFAHNNELPRFAGWWGHDLDERFKMEKGFVPMKGAAGWQLSCPPILVMAAHRASLEIFDQVGMDQLREKSIILTSYTFFLIQHLNKQTKFIKIDIITPEEVQARGCQLSLEFSEKGREIFESLQNEGIIGDWREPNAIRIAPVPLYNSFLEVYDFYDKLKKIIEKLEKE